MKLLAFPALLLILCLTGCVQDGVALSRDMVKLRTEGRAIGLLTVRVTNQQKPEYQFRYLPRIVTSNQKFDTYLIDPAEPPYRTKREYTDFVLSFYLEPGRNELKSMVVVAQWGLFEGGGSVPLQVEVNVQPNTVVYLGRIDVVCRRKKSDQEVTAGPVYPSTPAQIGLGMLESTFDVKIQDFYDEDLKTFVTEYPILKTVKVEKRLLTQWVRPELRGSK